MPTPMHELQGSRTDVNEGGVDGVPLPLQSSFLDTTAAAVPSAPLLHPTADLLDLKQGFFSQIGGEPNAVYLRANPATTTTAATRRPLHKRRALLLLSILRVHVLAGLYILVFCTLQPRSP